MNIWIFAPFFFSFYFLHDLSTSRAEDTTCHLTGNVKVFCRVSPIFEGQGPSIIELPDDFTIRVNTCDDSLANPKKDYEFDRVYGPHVGQGRNWCNSICYAVISHQVLLNITSMFVDSLGGFHMLQIKTWKCILFFILFGSSFNMLYFICEKSLLISYNLVLFYSHLQGTFFVMFNHLCNQPWMDIMYLFSHMGKVVLERHIQWFLPVIGL